VPGGRRQSAKAEQAKCDVGLRTRVPALKRWQASPLHGGETERVRLRLRYLVSGYRPEPLPAYRGPVEDPDKDKERIGICCSGGGIRSAAFNLGVLQQLQRAKLLEKADYLAAVSGGSYIAAAFAMVRSGSPNGTDGDSDEELLKHRQAFDPGSPEEQYLRNRSDYLAPDTSAKLYLIFRIVLGFLFNAFFVALPFFAVSMLLGVLAYRHAFPGLVPPPHRAVTHCWGKRGYFHCSTVPLPLWSWLAPAALAAAAVVCGLGVMLFRLSSDSARRVMETWSTRLFIGALLLALITLALPELVAVTLPRPPATGMKTASATAGAHAAATVAPVVGGGIAALLAALAAQVSHLLSDVEAGVGKFKKLSARLQLLFAYVVAAVVGPLLLYSVVVFAMGLALANSGLVAEREAVLFSGLGALALFAALYLVIDITALSLHPFYKRRLCSAFALRRVSLEALRKAAPRRRRADVREAADAQETKDGVAMERDYKDLVLLSQTAKPDDEWPTLLVCASANVSDPGATPPGRHVTSFTFSAHSVGGPLIGATDTARYEQVFGGTPAQTPADDESERDRRKRERRERRERDLTLPAAVAMSGAAVAPSMGKLTRKPLTFLLALGNIRLGVWVPNPRWVDGEGSSGRWRRPRPSYLLRELLGRNRADGRYLFVTDGGHYENLGLVELLRRGCTKIYCFDASGGEAFGQLGDAVALARSELSVSIAIDPSELTPSAGASTTAESGTATAGTTVAASPATTSSTAGDASPKASDVAAQNAVKGTFKYANGVAGELVYARNVMTAGAPWDVQARHLEDPTFPHDSTTDQLYTDQKFESYRALGELAGAKALELMPVT
jgi:Patatin-like phospholipase